MADLDVRVRNIASEVTAAKLEEKHAEEKDQKAVHFVRLPDLGLSSPTKKVPKMANESWSLTGVHAALL